MSILLWIALGIVFLGFSVVSIVIFRGVLAIVKHERRWKRVQKDLYGD